MSAQTSDHATTERQEALTFQSNVNLDLVPVVVRDAQRRTIGHLIKDTHKAHKGCQAGRVRANGRSRTARFSWRNARRGTFLISDDLNSEFVEMVPVREAGRSRESLIVVTALFDPGGGDLIGNTKTVNLRLRDETLAHFESRAILAVGVRSQARNIHCETGCAWSGRQSDDGRNRTVTIGSSMPSPPH